MTGCQQKRKKRKTVSTVSFSVALCDSALVKNSLISLRCAPCDQQGKKMSSSVMWHQPRGSFSAQLIIGMNGSDRSNRDCGSSGLFWLHGQSYCEYASVFVLILTEIGASSSLCCLSSGFCL